MGLCDLLGRAEDARSVVVGWRSFLNVYDTPIDRSITDGRSHDQAASMHPRRLESHVFDQ